ncbi:MAG: hypothetical protein IJ934_04505 [Acetobacter sp.]|nr:hypothetical protein [Acetobacter sp.]
MVDKGNALKELEHYEDALSVYGEVNRKFLGLCDQNTAFKEKVVEALRNQSCVLETMKRLQDSIIIRDEIMNLTNSSPES